MATTKIKQRPDNKRRNGKLALYIQVCINSQIKLYPTGQSIEMQYWDDKSQKVKRIPGSNDHTQINLVLEKKHQEIKDIIFDINVQGRPVSFYEISEKLKPKASDSSSFNYWFDKFIESKSLENKRNTIKHYSVLRNQIYEFTKGADLQLDHITFEFYNDFKNWLIKSKDQTNSTVNKRLKILKTFLRFCSDFEKYDASVLPKFRMLEEKVSTKIALTQEEFDLIRTHDFSENKRLEKVRDLFIFACATGLRESDIQSLKKSNIKDGFIYKNILKTSEESGIPLNNIALEILEKYDYELPKISQQKLNSYLKEVGLAAGITDEVIQVSFQGGQRMESAVPRYSLLKSHVGRRTFITLSILKGIEIPVIQSITGHKDLSSFQKYIQINNQAKLNAMKKW